MQSLSEAPPDPPKGVPGQVFKKSMVQNDIVLSKLNRLPGPKKILETDLSEFNAVRTQP
jgi:hypothetical protein